MPELTVISAVVPVHNEAGFIDDALPELVADLGGLPHPFEIIVAENGSSDATAAIARSIGDGDPRIKVLELEAADYGAAMRDGFIAATGDWVVNFDIDYFSASFVADAMEMEADVVLASKRAAGSDDRRSAFRRLGTWGFNLLLRVLFRSSVSDTHGMKLISRAVIEDLVPTVVSTQDLFDTELVIRAERAGYSIAEIPATVIERRAARSSFIKRIPRTVAGMWRIRNQMRSEARPS
jgi:glycosyltransferase involved in cell wall biosynthesis